MSEQCKGVTRSGTRCKIVSNLNNGYCHLHLSQATPQVVAEEHIADGASETLNQPCSCEETPVNWARILTSIMAVIAAMVLFFKTRRKSGISG